ncbi:biotin synthase [Corynebacterium imitans]|uniref:Biotin synthase n=3 Tax=Corynebacterium TaxID=1716 RepID=A0A239YKU7_9CORY|nr:MULTISPECIES: biotin synthase BioB [Corynebacterium]MCG7273507.1 biotin synthase BioB [Corynebacterium afermentans]MCG7279161.1 biotin synthase BioB [Corynebacterium imitans]MCG7290772.1 biotin synthase BioB [Corynebacterium afermentans]MDC7107694.1 biotin synthase BioB [Corynebacterium afermentans]OAA16221.1 biotin synthase BioB [Corynebacterium afermentans subsp. afermentans]
MSHAPILDIAREKALEKGEGLNQEEILQVLQVPDEDLKELLEIAHETRIKHCGVDVSLEGIISLKTGGCPEDCHFCSQSGLFESPVRAVTLDINELVEAAKQSEKMGAAEFCIVAAVKSPTQQLLDQVAEAVTAIQEEVDISISASLGILTQDQARQLKQMGVSRYNHNFETAKSFFPNVVTTHTWEERKNTLEYVLAEGMETCCGGIIGLGESLEQRAEFAAQLAEIEPHEVPMNFLDPRPGTPFEDRPLVPQGEALRAVAAFRLAMPTAQLRFAGGTELALGDDGTEAGLLGGANAIIGGNYLTTLGRPIEQDREAVDRVLDLGITPVGQKMKSGHGALYDTIKAL